MIKKITISDKALGTSFKVAELIVKNMDSHIISEKLTESACLVKVDSMFGKYLKILFLKYHFPTILLTSK
jgi:hypothetical protein